MPAAMFVLCWLSRMALVTASVPADARLVTVIVIGAAVYLCFINWRDPEVVTEAQSLVPGVPLPAPPPCGAPVELRGLALT